MDNRYINSTDNPFGPNAHILCQIAPGSAVLDVGCGRGWLCDLLRREKGCHTTGIEIVEAFVAEAQERCDSIVRADVTDLDAMERVAGDFDYIVFADILEHIVDPVDLLKRACKKLKPGGKVIVSIPNVAHYSMRLHLLFGQFQYTDEGLLDRTHLRFFTYESSQALLRAAGFKIIHKAMSIFNPAGGHLSPLKYLHLKLEAYLGKWFPNLIALQNIYTAVPDADSTSS